MSVSLNVPVDEIEDIVLSQLKYIRLLKEDLKEETENNARLSKALEAAMVENRRTQAKLDLIEQRLQQSENTIAVAFSENTVSHNESSSASTPKVVFAGELADSETNLREPEAPSIILSQQDSVTDTTVNYGGPDTRVEVVQESSPPISVGETNTADSHTQSTRLTGDFDKYSSVFHVLLKDLELLLASPLVIFQINEPLELTVIIPKTIMVVDSKPGHTMQPIPNEKRLLGSQEVFLKDQDGWYYAGTYQNASQVELSREEFSELPKTIQEAIYAESLSASKKGARRSLLGVKSMYHVGELQAMKISLTRVSINHRVQEVISFVDKY